MPLLRQNEKTGEIYVSNEGALLGCIKNLKKKDHTQTKSYYNKALIYIYHTYKKKHDFDYLPFSQRAIRVSKHYLAGYDISKFQGDRLVDAVIQEFIDQQYSPKEYFYEGIKEDFVQLLNHIKSIPMKVSKKIEKTVIISLVEDGKPVDREVGIKDTFEFDNSDVKLKALESSLKLIKLETEIKEQIVEEERQKSSEYSSMNEQNRF